MLFIIIFLFKDELDECSFDEKKNILKVASKLSMNRLSFLVIKKMKRELNKDNIQEYISLILHLKLSHHLMEARDFINETYNFKEANMYFDSNIFSWYRQNRDKKYPAISLEKSTYNTDILKFSKKRKYSDIKLIVYVSAVSKLTIIGLLKLEIHFFNT